MNWNELTGALGSGVVERGGNGNPPVNDIVYDSRRVKPGAVYVAIPGMKVHGDTFINDAIKNGAAAIVSENCHHDIKTPWVKVPRIRSAAGILGRKLWNIDTNAITLIGVTGTNGKTTTVYLFKNLLDELCGEKYSWMFGTVENKLGLNTLNATHTTPESVDIFRYIRTAHDRPKGIAMEVSSHSLALSRVAGLEFDVAVWTNLTQDHLDFHGTMENYYAAKKLLFTDYLKNGGVAVINVDDEYGNKFFYELIEDKHPSIKRSLTYGRSDIADVGIMDWKCDWDGTTVVVNYDGEDLTFTSKLRGFFNVYNMTAMIAGAFAMKVGKEVIDAAFAKVEIVAGRMEKVDIGAPFTVVVDYAHTPDALENILKTSAELTSGRVICVFGCGGDRDKTKRPIMGKVVSEHCDEAVITSDNPRGEKPQAIIDDIVRGIPLDFPYKIETDRKEAIKLALQNARAGDCVIVAGKGHETYQEIKGVRYNFDDKKIVIELYAQMQNAV